MYIVASIAIIALIELVVMVLYRRFEIRRGKVAHTASDKSLYNALNILWARLKKNAVYFVTKKIHVSIKQKRGIIRGIANNKNQNGVKNTDNSPSLYLKDIAEHKNNMEEGEIIEEVYEEK